MISKNIVVVLLFIFVLGIISGCTSKAEDNINGNVVKEISEQKGIEKLEIYHFHKKRQCYSCITMGDYAEETINTYFADEMESGKIVFDHINMDILQNAELVKKYGATGSSIWLGTYKGEEFSAEENVNVWYKIKDKADYVNYFKGVIEQKLAGE